MEAVSPSKDSPEFIGWEESRIRASQKDPCDFAPLYEHYYPVIVQFIYRRVDCKEVAFDITSQTFIKALTNIVKFEIRGISFSFWLHRIAINEMNKYFNKDTKHRAVVLEKSYTDEFVSEIGIDDDENYTRLTSALTKLEQEDLHLIELRFFEKKSFKEVGQLMDITENNAKVKVYRIIDKLKKFF